MSGITTRQEKSVLHIEISRLDSKNALSIEMYRQLTDALTLLNEQSTLHVGVIYGSENCFCAGNDLKDFMSMGELDDEHPTVQFIQALQGCTKPTVAAVAGPAIGIGTTMLLHCDMIIAANNAKFQLPFAHLGLCPEAGSSYLLPKLIGHVKAFEYLVLGKPFSAEDALAFQIVNQVVMPEELIKTAISVASEISLLPQTAVISAKKLMKNVDATAVESSINSELKSFTALLKTDECQSRIASFFKK